MSSKHLLFAASAALAVALVGIGAVGLLRHRHPGEGKQRLEPLWPAPAFAYVDQHGAPVTDASLRGKVWVANFIFTECRTICPMLTAKMVQLQRQLEGVDARFVSFSVDPAHDTPAVLAAYARRWREEPRWSLLATDAASLPTLARDFHIVAQANVQPDALDPIMHSATFLLVDEKGLVRGAYDSDEPDSFKTLVEDVLTLSRSKAATTAPLPETGPELYRALSCDACHENPSLAPALAGLVGDRRALEHAQSAVFDAAYVRESILQPNAKRLAGYPLRMPTYVGLIDEARLLTLVKWILTRPAAVDAAAPATIARDPVCGMDVRVDSEALQTIHDGHPVYFCSSACRARFLARPAQP